MQKDTGTDKDAGCKATPCNQSELIEPLEAVPDDVIFGQMVTASATYRRTATYIGGGKTRKEWVLSKFNKPLTGVFLGYRTLRQGVTKYGYDDEPPTFKIERCITAALVCFGPYDNPVYVPTGCLIL